MTFPTVEYPLQDGYIHHWLAAGPQAIPAPEAGPLRGASAEQIAAHFYKEKSGIVKPPVEVGPLEEGTFKIGEFEGAWSYVSCAEDHCIDHSAAFPSRSYMRSWAYTLLASPNEQAVKFTLYSRGPAEVWINQQPVYRRKQFSDGMTHNAFQASLQAGENEILARFEAIADPAGALVLALRAEGNALTTRIPTLIPSLSRREELERVYAGIYLDRDVYAPDETINLVWPEEMEKGAYNDVYFRVSSGFIQGQAEDVGKPGDRLFLGHPVSLREGACRAQVLPRAWEYYQSNIRISKELNAYNAGRSSFSASPYGTPAERRQEALLYAAGHEGEAYAEFAKIALGRWDSLDSAALKAAIEQVKARQEGSIFAALGFASAMIRFSHKQQFPKWLKPLVKEALCAYRYSAVQPGGDAMDFHSESRQVLFGACELLAGQLYPQEIFCDEQTGQKHSQTTELRLLDWMQARAQQGFAAWNSSETYAETLAALSVLVDLARSEPVWGLASVLLDKLFFSMALNSYRGVFGSSQGQAATLPVRYGLLEPTSGIARILWGQGAFNLNLPGIVLVALMRKYELPPIINAISAAEPDALWNREQQGDPGGQTANLVSYRTPDGMLASAQDYLPGSRGKSEHIWQATLGPKSAVFTNHPALRSEKDILEPNFWRGNGVLPRVAQWKDALVAIYNLPADDLTGFTHAWFPTIEFDEAVVRDGWAFARKGAGYLALTASQPIEQITHGATAYRELRAAGHQTVWVCQMGRQATDGSFADFQEKLLAAQPAFDGLSVRFTTLRGEQLSFGWEGPFLRDGQPQALSGFKHVETLYCQADFPCKQMEIKTEDYILRLNFDNLDESVS